MPFFKAGLDIFFESLRRGGVIFFADEFFWKVIFVRHEGAWIVVGVFVIFTVIKFFHELGGGIANMKGDGEVSVILGVRLGGFPSGVDAV